MHLGCGQVYLDGYINIDQPSSKHTLQAMSKADETHNLLTLSFCCNSVDEVRLHHVFEHFTRPIAIALLASWASWLKCDGLIHIEVPDFERTSLILFNPFSKDNDKKAALRHIFGSNEAEWAVHYEGWSFKRLKEVFEIVGLQVLESKKRSYRATRNIAVIGIKKNRTYTLEILKKQVREYLSNFLVDKSNEAEQNLLEIWMADFVQQYERTSATNKKI